MTNKIATTHYIDIIKPVLTPQDVLDALDAEERGADQLAKLNPAREDVQLAMMFVKDALHRLRVKVKAGFVQRGEDKPDV